MRAHTVTRTGIVVLAIAVIVDLLLGADDRNVPTAIEVALYGLVATSCTVYGWFRPSRRSLRRAASTVVATLAP